MEEGGGGLRGERERESRSSLDLSRQCRDNTWQNKTKQKNLYKEVMVAASPSGSAQRRRSGARSRTMIGKKKEKRKKKKKVGGILK